MACNKVRPSTRPGKKKMVKGCEGGKEKIIHFGAKGYGHNYSPAARKSFKARHKCGTAKSKLTARYWACKHLWAGKGGSTKSSPKKRRGKYQYLCVMAKKKKLDIEISPKERGSFSRWAKKKGMSSCEAAKMVMGNTKKYSEAIVKKANFAKNFACKKK